MMMATVVHVLLFTSTYYDHCHDHRHRQDVSWFDLQEVAALPAEINDDLEPLGSRDLRGDAERWWNIEILGLKNPSKIGIEYDWTTKDRDFSESNSGIYPAS